MNTKRSLTDFNYAAAVAGGAQLLVDTCHGLARECGWWTNIDTGEDLDRNDGEILALIHSEISEALEGVRKDKQDDHLPSRKSVEVELADAVIRICDYAGARGYDLGGAIVEKLLYNSERADHKLEERKKPGGKRI